MPKEAKPKDPTIKRTLEFWEVTDNIKRTPKEKALYQVLKRNMDVLDCGIHAITEIVAVATETDYKRIHPAKIIPANWELGVLIRDPEGDVGIVARVDKSKGEALILDSNGDEIYDDAEVEQLNRFSCPEQRQMRNFLRDFRKYHQSLLNLAD